MKTTFNGYLCCWGLKTYNKKTKENNKTAHITFTNGQCKPKVNMNQATNSWWLYSLVPSFTMMLMYGLFLLPSLSYESRNIPSPFHVGENPNTLPVALGFCTYQNTWFLYNLSVKFRFTKSFIYIKHKIKYRCMLFTNWLSATSENLSNNLKTTFTS